MIPRLRSRPRRLIAAGLFGMAICGILVRAGHPAILASDALRGGWMGVCIGLELLGLGLLCKRTRDRVA